MTDWSGLLFPLDKKRIDLIITASRSWDLTIAQSLPYARSAGVLPSVSAAVMEVIMASKKINLIVSVEKKPLGSVKPGQKLQVVAVTLTGGKAASLKKAIGARLCGGSGTCLALMGIDKGDPVP
jgi:hypothetical protein